MREWAHGVALMVPESEFSDKQRALYDLMSEISEEQYCAVWMRGNDRTIWRALQTGDLRYGMGEIDANLLRGCKKLSIELDGWIVWVGTEGPYFVQMPKWLEIYSAGKAVQEA